MKRVVFYLFITLYAFGAYAQLPNKLNLNLEGDSLAPVKKVEYSLQTGSMFYAGSMKGSTFYVAPGFSYKFSNKFKMEGGVMLMNNNYTFSTTNEILGSGDKRLFSQPNKYSAIVYAKGNYQVNSKLTISGSIVKNFNDQSAYGMQNPYLDNFQMMSMGLNYKLSPNVTLGAGVRIVQGNNFSSMYGSSSMYHFNSPFYPLALDGY